MAIILGSLPILFIKIINTFILFVKSIVYLCFFSQKNKGSEGKCRNILRSFILLFCCDKIKEPQVKMFSCRRKHFYLWHGQSQLTNTSYLRYYGFRFLTLLFFVSAKKSEAIVCSRFLFSIRSVSTCLIF